MKICNSIPLQIIQPSAHKLRSTFLSCFHILNLRYYIFKALDTPAIDHLFLMFTVGNSLDEASPMTNPPSGIVNITPLSTNQPTTTTAAKSNPFNTPPLPPEGWGTSSTPLSPPGGLSNNHYVNANTSSTYTYTNVCVQKLISMLSENNR